MAKSINVTVAVAVILFCSHTTSVFCNDGLFGFTYQKSNKITEVGENWDSTDNVGNLRNERSVHRVSKRQVNYDIPDDSLQQYIVDYHNRLRRQEGASDMEYMTWNQDLAIMAGLWGEKCLWKHGQPDYNNPPYNPIGQNLYISSGIITDFEGHIDRSMFGWYDQEKPFYNFEFQNCTEGEQCGHYTQVVWSSSKQVGCAKAFCETTVGFSGRDATYVVCNYGPAGNYGGQDPYLKGDACTECKSGQHWCDDGLCRDRDECPDCVTDECSCSCPKGFTGPQCADICQDNHESCGANPGWPSFWCIPQYQYVLDNCPKLCGLCEPADGTPVTCEDTTTTTMKPTTTTTEKPTTTTTEKPTTTTTTEKPTTTTTTEKPTTTTTDKATTTTTMEKTTTTTTKQPTTTTSSEPTTTTTVTTTTQVDCTGYCDNGGVSSIVNNECRCRCSGGYQGDRCQESREEATVGILVTLYTSIDQWELIWTVHIRPIIVRVVNSWCNNNVMRCCPGASIEQSSIDLIFTTVNQVVIGQGYPQEYIQNGRQVTVSLLYAMGAPDNELCTSSLNSVNRRKRELPAMTLSQDALMEIVQSVEGEINETLYDCCSITVAGIEAAQEDMETTTVMSVDDDDDEEDKKGPLGLDLWIWVVIGIGGCTFVLASCCIVICCCCILKDNSKSKSKKYEATTSAPVNGYDNNGYSNGYHGNKH